MVPFQEFKVVCPSAVNVVHECTVWLRGKLVLVEMKVLLERGVVDVVIGVVSAVGGHVILARSCPEEAEHRRLPRKRPQVCVKSRLVGTWGRFLERAQVLYFTNGYDTI